MSGALSHSGTSGNFTWGHLTIYGAGSNGGTNSLLIGDDVTIGDCNLGGIMGMKSTGANCGFKFFNSSGTAIGVLQSTAGTLQFDGQNIIHSGNISSQSVNYATSAGSAPASDVYAWAKASTKPSYTYSEVGASAAHQTDFAFNVKHNSQIVTFDKSNPSGAPSQTWFNGFVSTHNNYLSSYIINEHRNSNWWVGYSENTTAPTWYKLIHSGNIGSQSVNYASSAGSVSWSNVTNKPSSYTFSSTNPIIFTGSGSGTYNCAALYVSQSDGITFETPKASDSNSAAAKGFYIKTRGGQYDNLYVANAYANSDRHLKKSIRDIPTSSLDELFSISDKLIKSYVVKSTGKASYGFIAQQLEQYIPEAITEDSKGIKSVSYDIAFSKLLAAVICKIKSLEALL